MYADIIISILDMVLQSVLTLGVMALLVHAADMRDYAAHLERRIEYLEKRRK